MTRKLLTKISLFAVLLISFSGHAQTVSELSDRIDNLEIANALQKIKWRGLFETRYESFKRSSNNAELFHMKLPMYKVSLDANARVSDKINFYSRFTNSKIFNIQGQGLEDGIGSFESIGGYSYGTDSVVRVEKAYIDYSMTNWMIWSLGRLPTVNGPPTHKWDGVSKQGTYPILSYSSTLDGVGATFKLNQWMPTGYNLALRFLSQPIKSAFFTPGGATFGPFWTPAYTNGTSKNKTQTSNVYVAMIEGSTNKFTSVADEIGLIGQYLKAKDLDASADTEVCYGPSFATTSYPSGKCPQVDYTGANTGILRYDGNTAMWDYSTAVMHMYLDNIANLGLDFNFTYIRSDVHSRGFTDLSAISKLSAANGQKRGVLTDSTTSDHKTGEGLNFMVRYKIPFEFLKNPFIGVEGLKTSRYYIFAGIAREDPTNWHGTMGEAWHMWYNQEIYGNLRLRLGYRKQIDKWAGFAGATNLYGDRTRQNIKTETVYAKLRLDF